MLIGTAVVGATTMIFSIVVALTNGLQPELLSSCRYYIRRSCSA